MPPATIATTIVSPMARDKPTISAATIPETAAGTTIRMLVVLRRAPSPYDASRNAPGTACNASSEIVATSGIVKIPTPIPAAARLKMPADANSRWITSGLITCSAK